MRKTPAGPDGSPPPKPTLRDWFQLCRLPNLLTAPGDPMAGFLLANTGLVAMFPRLIWVSLASLCFYTGGLVFNDWADRETDALERPDRPLPSSRVAPGQAFLAGSLFFALGLLFCVFVGSQTFWLGVCLCVLIQTYNLVVKEICCLGPLVMGTCRGGSLLLGASAARDSLSMGPMAWMAGLTLAAYIAAITHLSRNETGPDLPRAKAWLPFGTLALGLIVIANRMEHHDLWSRAGFIIPCLGACAIALFVAVRVSTAEHFEEEVGDSLQRKPVELPSLIGLLIGALLFLQASFIFASGKGAPALVLGVGAILCWAFNQQLRRRFYES